MPGTPKALTAATATLLAATVTATTPALAAPTPGSGDTPYARMDAYVHEHMAAVDAPGLAYAVVGPDGVEHRSAFGEDGAGEPVTEHTPFLWGSVAKPVTATAVLVLADEGRIELDAPVRRYLPAFGEFGGDEIDPTVRDLLTQSAGIRPEAAYEVSDVYGAHSAEFGPRVERIAASAPGPYGEHAYSSANYLLLGAIIEERSGQDLSAFLHDAVLDPAGMGETAITSAEEARDLGLEAGHQPLWGVPAPIADGVDDAGVSYGYLGGDLTALSSFAELQLNGGRVGGTQVIEEDTLAEAHTGVRPVPGSASRYGLGWREGELPGTGTPAVYHFGATPGHSALVIMLPERERAVVVLQNAYSLLQDAQLLEGVGLGMAALLAEGDPPERPGASLLYPAAVWGATAAALALAAGTVLGVRMNLARRLAARPRPRLGGTLAWALIGGAAVATAGWLLLSVGPHMAMTWLPDITVAVLVAGALGVFPALLRVIAARRGRTR
ncbi:CubicO group peptidase (beta-lactamase class C family) [Lipingzhangella halophila]|uniref:CubicO group peptidase (Beta-lactamase class C family) n=1 Tax=Lipingzhangella halophila TaxID=1783352 RepID=A0A7W7W5Z5_9ACTN|nr:serine hydrolase domain-containing protein [Lipingzhangella halophila]MBB4935263.1 CubicO group peptidase (beta-lactamase class C family) [Lipingzhangella halophila]